MPESHILKALASLSGIELFPELNSRLDPGHLEAFAGQETACELIRLLRNSVACGPLRDEVLAQAYLDRGELRALRSLPPALLKGVDMAAAFAKWQRKVTAANHDVEDRAAVCDRERIHCPDKPTWAAKVSKLKDEIEMYADYPGCQLMLIERCRGELDEALVEEKNNILSRIGELRTRLDERASEFDATIVDTARQHLEHARQRVENHDFVVGCRRLEQAEMSLSEGLASDESIRLARFARPRRLKPEKQEDGHAPFRALLRAAQSFGRGGRSNEWTRLLENPTVREEVLADDGFVNKHGKGISQEWGGYFKAFRAWLGLQNSRKMLLPLLPKLQANRNFWSGPSGARAIFAFTQPWQGAPFYDDSEGGRRVLAIVRPPLTEADWNRRNYIEQLICKGVAELMVDARDADSDDERKFAKFGLVMVLLPGDFLAREASYRQFHQRFRIEGSKDLKERIVFLDDIDLLRIVPLEPDQRLRGLLELALPRFSTASQHTYFDSNPVAPRMFFGRDRELAELDSKATVVFSGRKIGKSSLLRHQVERCMRRDDERAIWLSCAGVAPWHSWRVLEEIAFNIKSLLAREQIDTDLSWSREQTLPPGKYSEEFQGVVERVKTRFRDFLSRSVESLRQRGISRLFILLDEADSFARAEWIENSGVAAQVRNSVSWFLRDRENELTGFLRIVFAGYDELGRKENLCHSAFGNWGTTLNLGPLEEADARRLICEPLAALGILVNLDAADLILDYTSGHASLIQAFCARLIDVIAEKARNWPLEDFEVEYTDVRTVGDRSDFRDDMAKTLSLNLGIARTYPLELVFFALASPVGLGGGRRLGHQGFMLSDALAQFEGETEPIRDFSPTTVEIVLDLLIQLGLLELATKSEPKKYRFRARHYVNFLRTQNSFSERLKRSLFEWNAQTRPIEIVPRHIWTLCEEQLAALSNNSLRVALVCGLKGSGREFLAETLAPKDSIINVMDPDWSNRFNAVTQATDRSDSSQEPIVLLDLDDRIAWEDVRQRLINYPYGAPPLRWIAGPRTAWDLTSDFQAVFDVELFGMGVLTPAELDGWIARRLGDSPFVAPSSATIKESDKALILAKTGGLLPVLEQMRKYFRDGFPDPFVAAHAEDFCDNLRKHANRTESIGKTLMLGVPADLSRAIHELYIVCCDEQLRIISFDHLNLLRELYPERLGRCGDLEMWQRVVDTAQLLGFFQATRTPGQWCVPYDSALGIFVRHVTFAESS